MSAPESISRIQALRGLIVRANPVISVFAFFGGVAWDAATLVRVDYPGDNLYLAACLLVLGVMLTVEHRVGRAPEQWPLFGPHIAWISYGAQFLFGSLFSAYVVFYFRATTELTQGLFPAAMAALLVANEFFHDPMRDERLRVLLYWLCVFSFLLFAVPVFTGWAWRGLFVIAAAVAMAVTTMVVMTMYYGSGMPLKRVLVDHGTTLTAAFLLIAGLHALDAIPPVPITLMDQGVFHGIARTGEVDPETGRKPIELTYEDRGVSSWWAGHDAVYSWVEGDKVHFFSAIFAPSGMTLRVLHRWERWDEQTGAWVQTDEIDVSTSGGVQGGSDHGYRTWSAKSRVSPGLWRVLVELGDGSYLGGRRFLIREAEGERTMATRIAR